MAPCSRYPQRLQFSYWTRSNTEKQQIQRRDDLGPIAGETIFRSMEIGSGHGHHARHYEDVIDPQHFDDRHQAADGTGDTGARHQRGNDSIRARIGEIGLQDGYEWEGPTRARNRVVEYVILARAHGASSSAG